MSQVFSVTSNPGEDVWRKPPSTDVWNPTITRTESGNLKRFESLRFSFWGEWKEQYDQGIALIGLRKATAPQQGPAEKWIKCGIEYYNGKPLISIVGCDRWADWSVAPLDVSTIDPKKGLHLELVREKDVNGVSLWVYHLKMDEAGTVKDKTTLRELTWVFADENKEDWIISLSPVAARPEKGTKEQLVVNFTSFKVEWSD